ncbi:ribonuclease Oy-like [Asterias amurensis]|uniref:ribonuclease Oy-like n=1 Tax=Asterias amurensis TaxID=7602 RepID=UPI003AB79AE2
MCAHYVKFACIFVLMFACEGILGEWTCLPDKCVKSHSVSHDWDYLQFVVQWPQSVCLQFNYTGGYDRPHHHKTKKCIIPSNIRNWTIHGTWPTKTGTLSPQCCNNSWTFTMGVIDDLVPEMNQSWPNLFVGGALGSFWCHEWGAHGTCCANLPALYGEHNYFSKTMDLRQKFDIDNILSDAGIVPSLSTRYKLTDIQQAVQNATGAIPNLSCFFLPKKKGSLQYLSEIRLCLDETFEPRDCPVHSGNSSSNTLIGCKPSVGISLPPIS